MSNHERPSNHDTPEHAPLPEVMSQNEQMTGLTTRLLLGGAHLNPATQVENVLAPSLRLQDATTSLIARASMRNRSEFWETRPEQTHDDRVTAWKNETKGALLSLNTKLAADTEKQTRWKAVLSQAGITDLETVTDTHMQNFYDRYFSGENKESNVSRFVEDIARKYITDGKPANYAAFYNDMDAVSWLGNIFGEKIAKTLPSLLEARLMRNDEEKQTEIATKANHEEHGVKRVNRLTEGTNNEKDLLTYIWTHSREITDNTSLKYVDAPKEVEEKKGALPVSKALPTPTAEEEEPEPAKDKETEITSPIDETPDERIEARTHPNEISDFLFNVETGELTGERFDLSKEYAELVSETEKAVLRNPELFADNSIVFSNLALTQIKKIAELANKRNVELGFELGGIRKRINGKDIAIGAFVVPLMDFKTAERTVTSPDGALVDRLLRQMIQNTNLTDYILRNVAPDDTLNLASFHIHQEPLGKYWRANPSQQDYDTLEDHVRNFEPGMISRWGVFTQAEGKLFSRLFATSMTPDGSIHHNPAKIIPEIAVYE